MLKAERLKHVYKFQNRKFQNFKITLMEVHHHPHVEKKNFKEYLLEGLMIFLAVSMGFIAENIRESTTAHEKEKQYVESMLQDLKEDTVKINIGIEKNQARVSGLDSLVKYLYAFPYSDSCLNKIYDLRKHLRYRAEVFFTKRTLVQLKNSGGLQLIKNMAISDSIVNYDEQNLTAERQWEVSFNSMWQGRTVEYRIFDLRYDPATPQKNRLLINDEKLLMEYANWVNNTRYAFGNYVYYLQDHKKAASQLIAVLKKEYHIEAE